jgi:hypothetical protein
MSLLHEVAITPDVFQEAGYSQPGFCDICLGVLKSALIQDTMVRDLRNGSWSRQFHNEEVPLHPKGRKLLKILADQSRLIGSVPELNGAVLSSRVGTGGYAFAQATLSLGHCQHSCGM